MLDLVDLRNRLERERRAKKRMKIYDCVLIALGVISLSLLVLGKAGVL